MNKVFYSADELGTILEESYNAHLNDRLHEPAFVVESIYLSFFVDLVNWMPEPNDKDIIDAVRKLSEEYYQVATSAIGQVLKESEINGTAIWKLMYENRLILRQDQQAYNRQITGKAPKGITGELWHDYNHWLLVVKLWEGIVNSLQPSFRIIIPSDIDESVERLLAPERRPLWGMWQAYRKLGCPCFAWGNMGKAIYVKPSGPLMKYKKQFVHLGKYYRNSRNNRI